MTVSSPRRRTLSDVELEEELARRIAAIERVFDTEALQERGLDRGEIARYYEQSRWAYRIFHSPSGVMHLALNPHGRFDKDGYLGQAREVERLIASQTDAVLELASGNGFNLRYLAKRHPDASLTGIDLVASQVAAAQSRSERLPNTRFLTGDFHRLPFAAETFDLAFAVESLCHALDLPRALREVRRVLRPGGTFVVIDGYRTARFERFPEIVRRAGAAAERALSVGRPWVIEDWLAAVADAGFEVVEDRDLTAQVLPTVRRLERIARVILGFPRAARAAHRLLPDRFLVNGIAVYLMQLTLVARAHTYRLVVLRRGSP